MMKKLNKISLLLLLLLYVGCETSEDLKPIHENYYIKYYGIDGDQTAVDMHVNEDGTILILGRSTANNKNRIFLLKVDAKGNELWQKTFGDENENPKDIEPTSAGNFIILSNIEYGKDVSNNSLYDIKLIVVNPNGEELGSKTVDRPSIEGEVEPLKTWFANSVTPLSDGGFYFTGHTTDIRYTKDPQLPGLDREDLIGYKLNSNFEITNRLEFDGGEQFGAGVKIFEDKNPGSQIYYFFGYTDYADANEEYEFNFLYNRINNFGLSKGQHFAGSDTDHETMYSITRVPVELGGGYISIGTKSINGSSTQCYVMKFAEMLNFDSGSGNVIFEWYATSEEQNGNLMGISIAPSNTGARGYLVLGDEISEEKGSDIYINKIDLLGNDKPGWPKVIGSDLDDNAARVSELPDGRIVVLATMGLATQRKIGLIVLNERGGFID